MSPNTVFSLNARALGHYAWHRHFRKRVCFRFDFSLYRLRKMAPRIAVASQNLSTGRPLRHVTGFALDPYARGFGCHWRIGQFREFHSRGFLTGSGER
jgi:hypothetical protein